MRGVFSLTPPQAKGGTGSVGSPMDEAPQRVEATDCRVLMCAFTVTSRTRVPAPRSGAPFPEGEGRLALPARAARFVGMRAAGGSDGICPEPEITCKISDTIRA